MVTMAQQIEKFFADYEMRFNKAFGDTPEVDVEGTTRAFTECFIEANPNGVICGKNDEEFRVRIPKGIEYYKSIGTQSMRILSLIVTPLDEVHAMGKIHWLAQYRRRDGSEETVDFEVIYFVQIRNDEPKIFAYITGDEERLLREKGLTLEK